MLSGFLGQVRLRDDGHKILFLSYLRYSEHGFLPGVGLGLQPSLSRNHKPSLYAWSIVVGLVIVHGVTKRISAQRAKIGHNASFAQAVLQDGVTGGTNGTAEHGHSPMTDISE
ncbi:hypothetical protein K449DRAFT_436400 [Hypoxylon sp. EC38]|nr:hypothetical protein K449DRAFT_436400 [Hypoxylon sp. EC38]